MNTLMSLTDFCVLFYMPKENTGSERIISEGHIAINHKVKM